MMIRSRELTPSSAFGADDSALRDHPLLGLLDDGDRAALAQRLERLTCEPAVAVVTQGDTDRGLYFVLEGEARALRDGMDIGSINVGEHFGELGLVLGTPRAVSIQALAHMELARLSRERYLELCEVDPQLATRLLETLLGGVAHRLEQMTESVGVLLRERSLPRRAEVRVRMGTQWQTVRTGTPVGALLPRQYDGDPVVAGLLDRRIVPLSWPISSPCSLDVLTTGHAEGQMVLRRSVSLLLLEAAYHLDPNLRVEMGYSLGFGCRVNVMEPITGTPARLARELEEGMKALIASGARAREEWWTVEEARDHFRDRGWLSAASLLKTWHHRTVPMCSYGEVYALSLEPLVEDARLLGGFHVISDTSGLILQYPPAAASRQDRPASAVVADMRAIARQTMDMTNPQEQWLAALGISSVGSFNDACIRGNVSQMIHVSEGFQEKRIIEIADRISAQRHEVRIICIAGPSSSGKTTFIKRLNVQLQVNGLRPVPISLDNYYIDRDRTPRDAKGEFDFEAFEALSLDLLRDHMTRLTAGEEVATALYDFHTGKSHANGGPVLTVGPDDILSLEGIHGLNPGLLPGIDPAKVFTIFVCPLAQLAFDRLNRINGSDVRLIRRIVRDRHGRNHNAAATIARWPSVRAGERAHIFPYQHNSSAVFDTSLLYELGVLKVFAQRYLLEVDQTDPSFATASRLLGMLDRFVTIYPDHVPPTSILREFIGSSGFEY